jgi:transcription initiation factor TFIIH subunit 2
VGPTNSLIRVGFPRRAPKRAHLTLGFSPGDGATPSLCDAPYRCPQCDAAHTELPTQCPVCARKLMSSVELTKTYHHLFPVPAYVEKTLPAPTPSATPPPTQQPIKQPIKAPSPPNLSSSTPSAPVDERDARAPRLGRCFGCADALPLAAAATRADAADGAPAVREVTGFECPACGRPFCAACDELVHSVLRACPGCELIGGEARTQQP